MVPNTEVHFEETALKSNIKKYIKARKEVVIANEIKTIGIVRDLAMLNLIQWGYFVDTFEDIFKDIRLAAVFYTNTLVILPADQRLKIIRKYHEAAIGGYRGMNETHNRIANGYYWRNMHPDVRQVILGCTLCQTKKLVRIKTKQAMLVTNRLSRPFEKISMDFYGPISKPLANQYTHYLSIQYWLSKCIVLVSVKRATGKEMVRAITDRFIVYFGLPEHLLSDQGTHFINKSMAKFARLFRIDKMGSTAFHSQRNGTTGRMHHTLTEYIKAYVEQNDHWDEYLPMCVHSYNTIDHQSTGYSPHELVFGQRARTPSSIRLSPKG
ncbi:uncharacterized protein LOC111642820 [Copidosoma floridanum]|uniref:uncharacterized protein LOC111642820 n=1 Tax=Copidosoma floridanum TaxID=29053 RepID=UPI000C6F7C1A|nr:uncharacterized protein LOC111642820 [Copidosoma floridanum]